MNSSRRDEHTWGQIPLDALIRLPGGQPAVTWEREQEGFFRAINDHLPPQKTTTSYDILIKVCIYFKCVYKCM